MNLQTERLVLRRWTAADREPFAAMNADPEVMRYFRGPLDRAGSDRFVDRIEAGFDEQGYGLWALQTQATGEFLGFTGLVLQTYEAPFTPAVEVGWRLKRSAWGHGYASEAARRALADGFERAGLAEIVSVTARSNERSQAVMRRLGMSRDPADDFEYPLLPVGHPVRPQVVFRLSAEQWRAQRARAGAG